MNNFEPLGSELNQLKSITKKRNPLCGIAHAIYHKYTGDFVPLEENYLDFLKPRNADEKFESNIDLKISPNPTSDIINVSSNYYIKEVKIYNLTGSLILSKIVDNTFVSLNLANLQSGLYLVEVTRKDNNEVEVMKIIKQ